MRIGNTEHIHEAWGFLVQMLAYFPSPRFLYTLGAWLLERLRAHRLAIAIHHQRLCELVAHAELALNIVLAVCAEAVVAFLLLGCLGAEVVEAA